MAKNGSPMTVTTSDSASRPDRPVAVIRVAATTPEVTAQNTR